MPTQLAAQLRSAAPALAELEAITAAPGLVVAHAPSHGIWTPRTPSSSATSS
ncbi:hypothetical protein [Nocardioides sp. B-3]|uniref:hypothetical protein n=1 Tax=Nocardioides sp. B-3 TaxID=2895565 RepID=UPI0021525ED0|nr:hypothetical protein [Nocardioides sp. B-3]UUZ59799.1 hypothetical protein LP418_01510 [Nocardioides sp. B-3]